MSQRPRSETQQSDHITLAAVNMVPSHNKENNLGKILQYIDHSSNESVDLIVFPESCLQGYPSGIPDDRSELEYQFSEAEPIPGRSTQAVAKAASESETYVIFGMTESAGDLGPGGTLYNTLVGVGPNGVFGKYRKVHTGSVEKCLWTRGNEWVIFDVLGTKIGPQTCYDLVFPEASRQLALNGAEVLCLSTAWPVPDDPMSAVTEGYDLFTRARALENQSFLIAAGLTGKDPDTGDKFLGRSRLVGPSGQVVRECGSEEDILIEKVAVQSELVRSRANDWFGQVFLRDRAPDSYRSGGNP